MRMISRSSRLPFRTIVLGTALAVSFAGGARTVTPESAAKAWLSESYGKLPLSFEANHGQSNPKVKFLSRGSGYSLFLTSNEAVLVLSRPEADASAVLRMTMVNANPQPQAVGRDQLPGKSHY